MYFLLRMAFWLGVVCVLLPSGGSRSSAPEAQIDAKQAVTLASAAVSDVRGFCIRQPNACAVGGKVASAIGHKAEAGARTIFRFITSQIGDITASIPARKTAGSTASTARAGAAPKLVPVLTRDRGTLTDADRQPGWHVRVPLPPRRAARNPSPSA